MSGETKSKTFEERLEDFHKILKTYTDNIGLKNIGYNSDVDILLKLNKKQLNALSIEDCAEGAFILSQYALFVQKEYNKQKVRIIWANKHLDRIVANHEGNYSGGQKFIKYELLRQKVINGDSAATALDGIVVHATARATELEDLNHNISNMARYLSQLERIKRNIK